MRARAREVNIFNMSLLDILCGALGAFCFMMLVLLPYYKPPSSSADLRQEQANTDDLLRQLEKLKEAAKDSEFAKQLQDLVEKLQQQVKQLQGEVNQYAAQNDQLTAENTKLKDENQRQKNDLDTRTPFLVTVYASPPVLMDLYIDDSTTTKNADGSPRRNPPFNPQQDRHPTFWPGDISTTSANGVATWMVRDTPTQANYKIYVKPEAGASSGAAATVQGYVQGPNNAWLVNLPKVTVTPTRFWTLVGTLLREPDGKMVFKEATQQERDAEWTKISKSAPPALTTPAPAASSPAPGGSSSVLSKEEMDKRREEYIRRRMQAQTPAASPNPTKSP